MTEHILLVDDDTNILAAYKRQLRKLYSIDTAPGPEEGLELVRGEKQYAVILSDMQMPVMNGVEFLKEARKLSPDSVPLMLTGNADQGTATDAINEGAVFRFLNKPCPPEQLAATIEDALVQYRLVTAEKQLLEETLKGSIGVLTDILSLVNPVAFGRARNIQDYVKRICKHVTVARPWELEIAAMLSQLGCVTIPEDTLSKVQQGENLTEDEAAMVQKHPSIAGNLIRQIPRLDQAAKLIECQIDNFAEVRVDGDTLPPMEMRILKAATALEAYASAGEEPGVALGELKTEFDLYGEELINAIEEAVREMPSSAREITFDSLRSGMVLAEALRNTKGQVLVAMGQEITDTILTRVQNFARNAGVEEPIKVFEASPRHENATA